MRFAIVLVAACGGSPAAPPDAAPDAPPDAAPDAAPGRTVTAHAINHFLPESGIAADAPSTAAFYILDAAGAKIAGTATGFAGVAPGPYLVCTGTLCIASAADALDLDRHLAGRSDLASGTASTRLMLTAGGLAQAGTLDELELPSQNTRATATLAVGDLATGANGILPFEGRGIYAASDEIRVDQLVTRAVGSEPYMSIGRTGVATPVAMLADQTTPTTVTLGADLPTTTVTVDLSRAQLTSFAGAINPTAHLTASGVAAFVELTGYDNYFPTLFDYQSTATADASLVFAYADPFPVGDGRILEAYADYAVDFTAAGAGTKGTLFAILGAYRALGGTGTLAPLVGPPQALTVGGRDATAAQTGVGITPMIAWTAPALGTADWYAVTVCRIQISVASGTDLPAVATFYTTATELQLPTGVMTAGAQYAILVEAEVTPGRDITTAPFAPVSQGAYAATISAALTP